MKKNRTMRVAMILLALTLTTSCFVGGTFAKYTTSAEGGDTARVAKWGVTASVTGGAFATSYIDDVKSDELELAVESSTTDKLVAPGTSGSFAGVTLSGTPEVAVQIQAEATFTVTGWMIDHDDDDATADIFYCPIVVTVGQTAISGLNYDNAGDFEDAVAAAIEDANAVYEPKTDLEDVMDAYGSYTWVWAFEDAKGTVLNQTNAYDTLLGNLDTAPEISLGLKVTVEQID